MSMITLVLHVSFHDVNENKWVVRNRLAWRNALPELRSFDKSRLMRPSLTGEICRIHKPAVTDRRYSSPGEVFKLTL